MEIKFINILNLLVLQNLVVYVCTQQQQQQQQQNGLFSLTLNYVLSGKKLKAANVIHEERNVGMPVHCATKCYVSFLFFKFVIKILNTSSAKKNILRS